ncbi:NAD(P)-binding protein [Hypoxylon sp. NC1633]|nr:NAD(P)-binding protein [Hypoxylon sp. NC1633]
MSFGANISALRQAFPGKATFTEKDVPDLTNKVIIVTGSNSGLGKELARILYSKNAKVYMMARSETKTKSAMDDIKASVPKSNGDLYYIHLDLADLTTIKASADEFLRREQQLHLLFNNAGVGYPEPGSKTKQGYEIQLGVNCIGTFALTQLLTPILVSTAKASPANSVRLVWVSSSAAEGTPPKGFVEKLPQILEKGVYEQYCTSKLGNYFHSHEFAARHKADGVVSVALNPGNLDSDFWRHLNPTLAWILRKTFLYPVIFGTYTELFAGFSPEVTLEKSGQFIAPWGKLWKTSKQMASGTNPKSEGGLGTALDFWDWTQAQVDRHM